jgi:hypothetical protein
VTLQQRAQHEPDVFFVVDYQNTAHSQKMLL